MEKRGNKKGQLTLFIILAIVIVAIVALYFLIGPPRIIDSFTSEFTAEGYVTDCLENEKVFDMKDSIAMQGGSINPENFMLYQDNKLEYLCYTKEYYKTCLVQRPLIKQHFESELEKETKAAAEMCLERLKGELQSRGYSVDYKPADYQIEFLPNGMTITLASEFRATKDGGTISSDKFKIQEQSDMYSLMMIASSIVNWEARYGDSESTIYMTYYPDVKVQKIKRDDGTAYLLESRNTKEKFYFATRSVMWPAGYGLGEI